MVRLKFVVFALVALAVAGLQLYAISPTVGAPAESLALEAARSAALAARGEVVRQKQALVTFALEARTSAPVLEVLDRPATSRTTLTVEERLELLRAPVLAALPEEQRGEVLLWLSGEGVGAKATASEAATAADAAEVAALAELPSETLVHLVGDAPHLVTSFSLAPAPGTLVLAVPLSASVLEPVAPKSGQVSVALLASGKVIASAGPIAAAELESSLGPVKPGTGAVVARASNGLLGPVALPVLTGAPAEQTAQRVGFRVEAGDGLEAAAVTELSSFQGAFTNGQRTGLLGLLGLLGASLVWLVIIGGGSAARKGQDESAEEGDSAPLRASLSVLPLTPMPTPEATRSEEAQPSEEPTPGPEDFQFPPSSSVSQDDDAAQALAAGGGWSPPPSPAAMPAPAPVMAAPPSFVAAAPPARELAKTPIPEFAPTPVPQAAPAFSLPPPVAAPKPVDPFGMVSQGSPHDSYYGDDNPDATRVAAVPKELLQASANSMPSSTSSVVSRPLGFVPAVAAPAADPDEEHFHAVFNDFVSTRASCGEPADGVTYEKFALKLRKNRDQLVQKYACRTVRFQVYVKDGKAALKATPVKD